MVRPPWLYPYLEDTDCTRLGQPVFRPLVPLSFAGDDGVLNYGLVDTGSDAILAGDWVAERLGLDLEDNDGEATHRVGGRALVARYKTATLRLHAPDRNPDAVLAEWEASVGFVAGWPEPDLVLLGSIGFLDQWTITASRFAQALAVEDQKAFDERFGVVLAY